MGYMIPLHLAASRYRFTGMIPCSVTSHTSFIPSSVVLFYASSLVPARSNALVESSISTLQTSVCIYRLLAQEQAPRLKLGPPEVPQGRGGMQLQGCQHTG
jgi:hypothetical protein